MLLAYVILLATTSVSQGFKTTCDAPAVFKEQPATVTCHFGLSIQDMSGFKVDHYDITSKRAIIVSCYKKSVGNFECDQVKRGYSYEYSSEQTTVISILIKAAGPENEGKFVCGPLRPTDDLHPCNFSLKDDSLLSSTTSTLLTNRSPVTSSTASELTTNSSVSSGTEETDVAAIVAPVVTILALVVTVVVAVVVWWMRRQRRKATTASKDTNAESTTEESSLPEEEAKNKTEDFAVPSATNEQSVMLPKGQKG